jgi:hypothetical protein
MIPGTVVYWEADDVANQPRQTALIDISMEKLSSNLRG